MAIAIATLLVGMSATTALQHIDAAHPEYSEQLSINDVAVIDGGDISGTIADHSFGSSILSIGDIDGDGVDDFAVGSPGISGTASAGSVYILFMNADDTVKSTSIINETTRNGPSSISAGDRFGQTLTSLGDLDGDGIIELVVGAPGPLTGHSGTGSLYVLYLENDGTLERTVEINANTPNAPNLNSGDRFGWAVDDIGDINSDGVDDLFVTAPGDTSNDPSTAKMYVLFMNSNGTINDTNMIDGSSIRTTPANDDFLGAAVAVADDFDDDGINEVVVGATKANSADKNFTGSMYILYLDSAGQLKKTPTVIDAATLADLDVGLELTENHTFAESITNIDDLDGDGIDDLAVGSPGYSSEFEGTGDVHILFMNSSGEVKRAIALEKIRLNLSSGELTSNLHFGWFVEYMGERSIAVGTLGNDSVYFIELTDRGVPRLQFSLSAEDAGVMSPDTDHFGESIAMIGDLDGDGVIDMAVGAPDRFSGGVGTGDLFILYLNEDGTVAEHVEINADSHTVLENNLQAGDRFGQSVTGIGDLDGNNVLDLAVGAPGHVTGGQATGDLYIIFMDDGGKEPLNVVEINRNSHSALSNLSEGALFGQSVAAVNLDDDDEMELAVGAPGLMPQNQTTGGLYILDLASNGTVTNAVEITAHTDNGPVSLVDGDRFGQSVAEIGNLYGDDDGTVELAVGATGHLISGSATGDLYILSMLDDFTVKQTREINSLTPRGPLLDAGDRFGDSVAGIGDINHDGTIDIAVGAPGHAIGGVTSGEVYILLMNADGTIKRTVEFNAETDGAPTLAISDRFGRSVTSVGDLDGDTHLDIAIGAPASAFVYILFTDNEDSRFITTWETTTSNESITIPVGGALGTYMVDWGDGTDPTSHTGNATHTYSNGGNYQVEIFGDFTRISMGDDPVSAKKLISVDQWGATSWTTMERAFEGATNMVIKASDTPDLTHVTDMSFMFFKAEKFDQDISTWNVSSVTDMSYMFTYATSFNKPLNAWDTSSVTTMALMFAHALNFNQPIGDWDTSSVVDMHRMFEDTRFDQPLNNWDTSSVVDMTRMFANTDFNQPIGDWDTSSVTDMGRMFYETHAFNKDLTNWDVSSVKDMEYMFHDAAKFNGDISKWDTSSVIDMHSMFDNAASFNKSIDTYTEDGKTYWDVSNVTDMDSMFRFATAFNQPLNNWDVSNVTDMHFMFTHATAFDQPLNDWNTESVTDMHRMFADTHFNQPLNNWDVSNVTDMSAMFAHASDFNQPLNNWDVSNVTDMHRLFYHTRAFDQPLNDWVTESVTDMDSMFRFATAFNQPLNNWDVSNVTDMHFMFGDARVFNSTIGKWDVSNVTDMHSMFSHATAFNQPLGYDDNGNFISWDVSNVTDMSDMFIDADAFNQSLAGWDTGSVTDMSGMFAETHLFNQPIGFWDTSSVTDMSNMFYHAEYFDRPIGSWDVSNVTDMSGMFAHTLRFNQPLGEYTVDAENNRIFNGWNVSSSTDTTDMFLNARSFDQSLPWSIILEILTYHDGNKDAEMNSGEAAHPNVRIVLWMASNNTYDVVTTDEMGKLRIVLDNDDPFYVITLAPDGYYDTSEPGPLPGTDKKMGGSHYVTPVAGIPTTLEIGIAPSSSPNQSQGLASLLGIEW